MKTDQNNDYDLSEIEPEIVKSMSAKIQKWKNERMFYQSKGMDLDFSIGMQFDLFLKKQLIHLIR